MKSIKNKKINKKTKKVNKSKKLYNNIKGGGNSNSTIVNNTKNIERYLDNDIDSFVGEAMLNFKKYDSNPPATGSDKVYFFLEKLNDKNFDFWNNYNKYQELATRRNGARLYNGSSVGVSDGISSFKLSLDLYRNNNTGINNIIDYDIWIAYACKYFIDSSKPKIVDIEILSYLDNNNYNNNMKSNNYYEFDSIEITVTMCIDKKSPITSHMGISKNFLYFGWYKNYKVHEKLSLYLHSFIAKVSNYIYPENKKIYMATKPNKLMRTILDKSLTAYANTKQIDLNEVIIIGNNKDRNKLKLGKQKHNSNNKTKYNKYNYTREDYERYLTIKDEPSYKEDNSYIRPLLEEEELYISPLHNIDDENWSITYKGQDIEFEKPLWFKHPHLGNHLSTTIIDIEHLGNLYFADYTFKDYR